MASNASDVPATGTAVVNLIWNSSSKGRGKAATTRRPKGPVLQTSLAEQFVPFDIAPPIVKTFRAMQASARTPQVARRDRQLRDARGLFSQSAALAMRSGILLTFAATVGPVPNVTPS